MSRRLVAVSVAGWVAGLTLLGATALGLHVRDVVEGVPADGAAAADRGDVADQPPFSDAQALEIAKAIATARLVETVGSAHLRTDPEGNVFTVPASSLSGRALLLEDLNLDELRRVEPGEYAKSASGDGLQGPVLRKTWVVSWSRAGLTTTGDAPELSNVRITVVLEDGTGKLLSSVVNRS